jgi:hypothetical protein
LPCLKIGYHWRIRRGVLEDFLKQSERPRTLVRQLDSFLRVPDSVLAIAQNIDILHRLDAAFFRVGEARGGLLVKFYAGEEHSEEELLLDFEQNGLEAGRLERKPLETTQPAHRGERWRRGAHRLGLLRLGEAARARNGPGAAEAGERAGRRPPTGGQDSGHRGGDRRVGGVAAYAGAEYALGYHPGLGGKTVAESRHADAALLRGGATSAGELPRTPCLRTSENFPSRHTGEYRPREGPERSNPGLGSAPADPVLRYYGASF